MKAYLVSVQAEVRARNRVEIAAWAFRAQVAGWPQPKGRPSSRGWS